MFQKLYSEAVGFAMIVSTSKTIKLGSLKKKKIKHSIGRKGDFNWKIILIGITVVSILCCLKSYTSFAVAARMRLWEIEGKRLHTSASAGNSESLKEE